MTFDYGNAEQLTFLLAPLYTLVADTHACLRLMCAACAALCCIVLRCAASAMIVLRCAALCCM
jgi:hypothetical protein